MVSPARGVTVGGMVVIAVTACGAHQLSRPIVMPASPLAEVTTVYRRVLVAGFSTNTVAGVDTNQEASRLLRSELRTEASVQVVEAEPLRVERQALSDVPFWRRVGEEYRNPLIVTGVVDFQSIGPYYEERQVGRRTVRIFLPQFRLSLRLLLIDGATGEQIGAAVCGPIVAHAAGSGERALTLFYRLIDRTMPSVLAIFGRRTVVRSGFGPTCRVEAA